MKLWYDRKSKDPTYFIQVGIRNGKKTTTKNIARIGKHSELLKITDDPLSYAKEQVEIYNREYKEKQELPLEFKVDFAQKIKAIDFNESLSTQKNVGYLYLKKIYQGLEIDGFFRRITNDSKITFDPDTVNSFMTYARILDPDSKLGTFEKLSSFYENPDFDYQHIMRTMDLMSSHYKEYIEHLYFASGRILPRNTAVCYYDCTNFYCETEVQDEEYVDEVTGEIITGLRKFGLSKDHKPNPIVEMGLFMDTNGVPISMCLHPGNTNEQTTVLPLEKELVKMFGDKKSKFIYCADAGLGSYHIRNFNAMGGRAFVVTQSIKKLSEPLRNAVLNDCDYRLLSDDSEVSLNKMMEFDKTDSGNLNLYNDRAYKILYADTAFDVGLYEEKKLKNGKTRNVKSKASLKQRVIITFSRKGMEYQRTVRNRQIERAKKILDNMDPEKYRKGLNDVTRFIKKVSNTKDTYEIDYDRIKEEEKYDGFYAIATNVRGSAKDIIAINEQRYQIEDCFRIMKTNFASRPIYHRKKDRITAHFMMCFTALLIYRLIEVKVKQKDKTITTSNIIETMKNMEVTNIEDVFFAATYTSSKALTALESIFGLGLDKKYYLPKDINKKLRKNF